MADKSKLSEGPVEETTTVEVTQAFSRVTITSGELSLPLSPSVTKRDTAKYSTIEVASYAVSVAQRISAVVLSKTSSKKEEAAEKKEEEKKKKSEHKPLPVYPPLPEKAKMFAEKLAKANNVIVMVGAGLSVAAGIPDFRTPGSGLYSKLAKYKLPVPEAVFEINYFKKNPEPFRQLAKELWPGVNYYPTIGHYFIKLLHEKKKLLRCYTQNIDSLEMMTGLPKDMIVAAHGNFDSATCVFTRKKIANMEEVKDAYLNNNHDKLNQKYGTILVKPDIVFFGEELPDRFHKLIKTDFRNCDLLIVMGTSLQVHPFASLVSFPPKGTSRMLINRELVGQYMFDFDGKADVFLQGDCDAGCIRLAEALDWKDELLEIAQPKL